MEPDKLPLIAGAAVFAASILSLRLGVSVAIFEVLLGVALGNSGLQPQSWMVYIAGFGGILLTFLAGAEVDVKLLRENFRQAALLSAASFLAPFAGGFLVCRYLAGWSPAASLITGIALSETSLAVVYSVLVETGLSGKRTGKILMVCTFLTNTLTAVSLSFMFLKPNLYTLVFLLVSASFLVLAGRFTMGVIRHPALAGKVIEPEIKYVFFVLLGFIYLAELGGSQAILPAFIFGLLMSKHFKRQRSTFDIKSRMRTVAYAFITPMFFIVAGMKVSLPALWASFALFVAVFAVKQLSKFFGVYFLMKRYFPRGVVHSTLLLSTGLTFGVMAVLFGLKAGYLDQTQYSLLTGVLIASAVIPTFIAQKWFAPVEDEDLV